MKIIRDYCFAECILLENMEFPNSLYYLGDFALSKTGVKNIIIPDSFTELGKSVFYGCIYNHRTTKTNQKYPSVNL